MEGRVALAAADLRNELAERRWVVRLVRGLRRIERWSTRVALTGSLQGDGTALCPGARPLAIGGLDPLPYRLALDLPSDINICRKARTRPVTGPRFARRESVRGTSRVHTDRCRHVHILESGMKDDQSNHCVKFYTALLRSDMRFLVTSPFSWQALMATPLMGMCRCVWIGGAIEQCGPRPRIRIMKAPR